MAIEQSDPIAGLTTTWIYYLLSTWNTWKERIYRQLYGGKEKIYDLVKCSKIWNSIPYTKTRKQEKCLESGKRKELVKKYTTIIGFIIRNGLKMPIWTLIV